MHKVTFTYWAQKIQKMSTVSTGEDEKKLRRDQSCALASDIQTFI